MYGFNTAGAFVGALAGGFVLVPLLGLDGVVYAMGCVNLVAAAIFAQLDRHAGGIELDLTAPSTAEPVARFAAWASVSLLAGFAMMVLQTTFNRVGALAFGASQFTFASIVAVFVACIAVGSLAVSAIGNIPRSLVVGSQWLLVLLLFPLYLVMEDAGYWAHVIRALFYPIDQAFYAYHLVNFEAVFLVLFVPIGLSGALLPLLFHELRREVRELGAVAGRLYAWNTFGSLLGALFGRLLVALLARPSPRLSDRHGGTCGGRFDPDGPRAAANVAVCSSGHLDSHTRGDRASARVVWRKTFCGALPRSR